MDFISRSVQEQTLLSLHSIDYEEPFKFSNLDTQTKNARL